MQNTIYNFNVYTCDAIRTREQQRMACVKYTRTDTRTRLGGNVCKTWRRASEWPAVPTNESFLLRFDFTMYYNINIKHVNEYATFYVYIYIFLKTNKWNAPPKISIFLFSISANEGENGAMAFTVVKMLKRLWLCYNILYGVCVSLQWFNL